MIEDVPLPGMPEPPRQRVAPVMSGAKATRVRKRVLCNQCCMLIYTMGAENVPNPRTARWRVTSKAGLAVVLCESHKNEVMG